MTYKKLRDGIKTRVKATTSRLYHSPAETRDPCFPLLPSFCFLLAAGSTLHIDEDDEEETPGASCSCSMVSIYLVLAGAYR